MISTIYTGTYQEPEWKELKHWGIKGMKWGIRRYQNEDGTLTPEGKRRYHTVSEFKNWQDFNRIGNKRVGKATALSAIATPALAAALGQRDPRWLALNAASGALVGGASSGIYKALSTRAAMRNKDPMYVDDEDNLRHIRTGKKMTYKEYAKQMKKEKAMGFKNVFSSDRLNNRIYGNYGLAIGGALGGAAGAVPTAIAISKLQQQSPEYKKSKKKKR